MSKSKAVLRKLKHFNKCMRIINCKVQNFIKQQLPKLRYKPPEYSSKKSPKSNNNIHKMCLCFK